MKAKATEKMPSLEKGVKDWQSWYNWLFLAGVAVLYVVATIIDFELAVKALSSLYVMLTKILPVFGAVLVLLLLFNLLTDHKWMQRYIGEKTGLQGWLITIAAGILAVGPIYPWYVLLGDLKQKGMRRSLITAFLYSRAIKLPLLPLMFHAFGLAFTITLVIYFLLFAVLNGILSEVVMGKADR